MGFIKKIGKGLKVLGKDVASDIKTTGKAIKKYHSVEARTARLETKIKKQKQLKKLDKLRAEAKKLHQDRIRSSPLAQGLEIGQPKRKKPRYGFY